MLKRMGYKRVGKGQKGLLQNCIDQGKTAQSLVQAVALVGLMTTTMFATAADRVDLGNYQSSQRMQLQNSGSKAHEYLGLANSDLRALRSQTYGNQIVTRYEQLYQGVPVWSEVIVEHVDSARTRTPQFYGAMLRNLANDLPSVQAKYSVEQIIALAKSKKSPTHTYGEQAKLFVKLDANGRANLVYLSSYVTVDAKGNPSRPHFIMDANTGAVLEHWEGIAFAEAGGPGGNQRIGRYTYGPAGSGATYGPLIVTDACEMSSPNVDTYNMAGATSGSGTLYKFGCPTNTFKEINGSYGPLNDAHYFGNVVFNMYKDWAGVSPLAGKLKMRVHYGTNYENAFWDGLAITYGDGGSTFHSMVGLGLTGHEVSHGFTEKNSALVFSGMSGAINESFSDMAGEAAVWYMRGTGSFQVADDIKKNSGAIRYMNNPEQDGYSIGHASKFTSGMDVHHASGVFNKAFYLLATKPNWSVRKAFQIMVDANRLYWKANTTFYDAACGVMRAGNNRGYSVNDMIAAFEGVGVTNTVNCLGDVPPQYPSLYPGTAVPVSTTTNGSQIFKMMLPTDTPGVSLTLSGGTGNGDLYVQQNVVPTTTSYLARSATANNNEFISLPGAAGTYYVMVHGVAAVNGASLIAKYLPSSILVPGVPESITLAARASRILSIDVPAGKTKLTFTLSGGTGDGDLYARMGNPPTKTIYTKKSTGATNAETIVFTSPTAGRYYIMVDAYTAVTGASLKATFN